MIVIVTLSLSRFHPTNVNVDEENELAAAFQISSIPTIAVIKDGKVLNISVGYKSRTELKALVESLKEQEAKKQEEEVASEQAAKHIELLFVHKNQPDIFDL